MRRARFNFDNSPPPPPFRKTQRFVRGGILGGTSGDLDSDDADVPV